MENEKVCIKTNSVSNKETDKEQSFGHSIQQLRLFSLLSNNILRESKEEQEEISKKPYKVLNHSLDVFNGSGIVKLTREQIEPAKMYAMQVAENGTNWNYDKHQQEKLALTGTCGEMAVHTFATKVLGLETISGPDTKIYSSKEKSHSPDLILAIKTETQSDKISLLPCHIKTFRLWDTDTVLNKFESYNFNRATKYEPAWLFHTKSISKYLQPIINVDQISKKIKINKDNIEVLPGMVFLVIQITPQINYVAYFDWFYNIKELLTEFHSFNKEHQNKHSDTTRRLGISDILLGYPSISSDGGISFLPWWSSNLWSQISKRLGLK